MSLMVTFQSKTGNDNWKIYLNEVSEGKNHLFGPEDCRKTLWGNPILGKFRLRILPTIRECDVIVFDEELYNLKEEFEIILSNINEIAYITNWPADFIEFRVQNAIEYIEIALKHKEDIGIYRVKFYMEIRTDHYRDSKLPDVV